MRALWHLCWLLRDRDDAERRGALVAALAEGADDPRRPGIADTLLALL